MTDISKNEKVDFSKIVSHPTDLFDDREKIARYRSGLSTVTPFTFRKGAPPLDLRRYDSLLFKELYPRTKQLSYYLRIDNFEPEKLQEVSSLDISRACVDPAFITEVLEEVKRLAGQRKIDRRISISHVLRGASAEGYFSRHHTGLAVDFQLIGNEISIDERIKAFSVLRTALYRLYSNFNYSYVKTIGVNSPLLHVDFKSY